MSPILILIMPRRAPRPASTTNTIIITTPSITAVPLRRVPKQPPAAPSQHTRPRMNSMGPPPPAVMGITMVVMVVAPAALVVEPAVSVLSRLWLWDDGGGGGTADQTRVSGYHRWPWEAPAPAPSLPGIIVDGGIVAGGGRG